MLTYPLIKFGIGYGRDTGLSVETECDIVAHRHCIDVLEQCRCNQILHLIHQVHHM